MNNENYVLDFKFTKERGIASAVQMSAIITSYGRVSINLYLNIPGNEAIASNTYSLILTHLLPDDIINNKLGRWKLEHKFVNGVFVRPKLYCYHDRDSNK